MPLRTIHPLLQGTDGRPVDQPPPACRISFPCPATPVPECLRFLCDWLHPPDCPVRLLPFLLSLFLSQADQWNQYPAGYSPVLQTHLHPKNQHPGLLPPGADRSISLPPYVHNSQQSGVSSPLRHHLWPENIAEFLLLPRMYSRILYSPKHPQNHSDFLTDNVSDVPSYYGSKAFVPRKTYRQTTDHIG